MKFSSFHISSLPEAVYVHYPLCRHTCSYCDFNVYNEAAVRAQTADFEGLWLGGLERDLKTFSKGLSSVPLKTLYLGGGTPSLLSVNSIERLMQVLSKAYVIKTEALEEFTLECNPESFDLTHLNDLKSLGVTRPSLGIQTFQPGLLRRLERLATLDHIDKALEAVSRVFSNYSLDLMIGIPDQDLSLLEQDLNRMLEISPPHLSVYLLTLEKDHIMRTKSSMADRMPPDETVTEMYLRVCERMKAAGYEHYEVSNFAKPGYRSRHNSNYWRIESSYLGLGPGAHGYLSGSARFRYEMIRDPQAWLKDEAGVGALEALTTEQTKLEDFYLHLRTRTPIDLPQNPALLRDLTREGLIEVIEGEGFVATERGWLVIESLAQTLASN